MNRICHPSAGLLLLMLLLLASKLPACKALNTRIQPSIVWRCASKDSSLRRHHDCWMRRGTTWFIRAASFTHSARLLSPKQIPEQDSSDVQVEISPANHGTTPLNSLINYLPQGSTIQKNLERQGLTTPTPIQAHAIPLLQKEFDVMASAQTGSGKTLMFSLPLCQRLLQRKEDMAGSRNLSRKLASPSALIISPTRELAMQISSVIQSLMSKPTKLNVALATGGAGVKGQRQALQDCDILVGTPGRILQFVDERVLSLRGTKEVVIDEADRMLDLGFEVQLRRIARALGPITEERHTVLCSATFPPDVQRVASEFLKQDYYFVAAGRVGGTHEDITQTLFWVDDYNGRERQHDKRRSLALREIQRYHQTNDNKEQGSNGGNSNIKRTIVFTNTKDEAERVGQTLKRGGKSLSVKVVHGDKPQSERNESLDAFRRGKVNVLVATDVAARGLDVSGIGLVVQVDTPKDIDSYVHRIGRTGRAGAKGSAVAFLDGRSIGVAPSMVELMREAKQTIPIWLIGMSHVATARSIEEESAIMAGMGGSLDTPKMNSPASSPSLSFDDDESSLSEGFIGQDFRSKATAGSWGSERDTSFVAFDDEAYRSLDDFDATIETSDDDTELETVSSSNEVLDMLPEDEANKVLLPLVRQKPSKGLIEALERITGSKEVNRKPEKRILDALSKRGSNQRLRFEYLGMFEFDEVVDMLLSQRNKRSEDSKTKDLSRVLMVAEKPSIAKAIADALSGPQGARQKRGISRALPVYEFTSDTFQHGGFGGDNENRRCLITVTSVVGHVFSLKFVEENNQEGGNDRTYNDPSDYFRLPVVKSEEDSTGKLRVLDHLRALAANSDHLVLWLDCDAEGENIAHEVISVCRRALESNAQSDANSPGEARRVHRARFSAITGDALREAFGKLEEPDPALSRSVDARQELDLRVGVAMTRLLTWRCVALARRHFSPSTKLVSYGPCQSPCLSFCVDRALEIEAFTPKDYWKVHVNAAVAGKKGETFPLQWKVPPESAVMKQTGQPSKRDQEGGLTEEGATFDADAASQVVRLASSPTSSAKVAYVDNISETMRPPLGLNTVGLLTAGSKAMGLSPKQVMNVAEKLYSQGFISYPRTETTRYDPKGFDVRQVLRQHTSHPEWGRTASYLLQTKYANSGRPPIRGVDAGDHPPITSLKSATREEIGGGSAWRVYEFVTRNFLGSLGDDLKYTRSVAELVLQGDMSNSLSDPPRFQFEQVNVDSVGFAGACRWVLRDIGAEKDRSLVMHEGMTLSLSDARSEACSTKPPRFLQEHDLIELMDKNRIGTDASMATHVTNIVDRGYVELCDESGEPLRPYRPPRPGQKSPPRQVGRYLVPTSLGIGLMDLFGNSCADEDPANNFSPAMLSRPAIRAQMEEEVKQIAVGKLDKEECLERNLSWFEDRYNEFEQSLSKARLDDFARSLCTSNESRRYWRKLGAFEPSKQTTNEKRKNVPKGSGGKSRKNAGNAKGSAQKTQSSRQKAPVRNKNRGKSTVGSRK